MWLMRFVALEPCGVLLDTVSIFDDTGCLITQSIGDATNIICEAIALYDKADPVYIQLVNTTILNSCGRVKFGFDFLQIPPDVVYEAVICLPASVFGKFCRFVSSGDEVLISVLQDTVTFAVANLQLVVNCGEMCSTKLVSSSVSAKCSFGHVALFVEAARLSTTVRLCLTTDGLVVEYSLDLGHLRLYFDAVVACGDLSANGIEVQTWDGKQVDTLEGADPSSLANKVAKVAGSVNPDEPAAPASLGLAAGPSILEAVKDLAQSNEPSPIGNQSSSGHVDNLNQELKQLINSNSVMLFMKGNPEEPKCGFSSEVIDILKKEKVLFGTFDILTNQKVREGLKKFSDWPTYPQLYVKGELLGGCDVITEMHKNGQLKDFFKEHGIETTDTIKGNAGSENSDISDSTGLASSLTSRLASLIASSPVILFMKGEPEQPKCGFSRKVVEILQQEKVPFKSFDILTDDEVRQGLKVYSNWSSYPQLYIDNELIGGSDIVLEMQKSGELTKVLAEKGIIAKESLNDRLKKLISKSPVMLFMKGNPDAPRCGFSSKVVNALKEEGVTFGHFDILSDEEVREGLKTFSEWPTYPQLYYKGELVGGCDIILELKNSGELKATLTE